MSCRARLSLWLTRDMEINAPGLTLALDLLDELDARRVQLQRLGVR